MCKSTHSPKTGSGVLARMRHLKSGAASDTGRSGADANGKSGRATAGDGGNGLTAPVVAPILRLLSSDVMTEACCMLDVGSLGAAAATCRSFRDACQGRYPWRLSCMREWGLSEGEEAAAGLVGTKRAAGALAPMDGSAPFLRRLAWRDSILGADFRKLFPLIEEMPTGFDCSLLRDDANRNGIDQNNHDDQQPGQDGGEGGGREDGAAAPAAVAAAGIAGRSGARNDPLGGPGEEEEEEAGDFWIKGVGKAGARAGTAAMAGGAGPEEGAAVSSRDIALQVEFRGGVGVGNRCVRADLPLPSTVLRERKGRGAKSHIARHLATSPLALFRWLLSKMAATAAGAGGAAAARNPRGATVGNTGVAAAGTGQEPLHAGGGGGGGGVDHQQLPQQDQAAPGSPGRDDGEGEGGVNGWVGGNEWGGGQGGDGGFGERLQRSSSMPGGWGGREQNQGVRPPLLRPICVPVAIGAGVVDVTPRLVSYFEVAIGTPRLDPPHAIPDCIAVGLSRSGFHLRGKMPGWDANSYGYHSDDGGAFHDAGSMLFNCGPSFGRGDVVGCGLDYSVGGDSADIFFTLNGKYLGAAFAGVRGSFYPTVGIDSACPVRINVGREPFVFNLAAALRDGGQEAAAREAVAQLQPPSPSKISSSSAGGAAGKTVATMSAAGPSKAVGAGDDGELADGPSRSRQHSLPLPSIFRPFVAGPTANSAVALSY